MIDFESFQRCISHWLRATHYIMQYSRNENTSYIICRSNISICVHSVLVKENKKKTLTTSPKPNISFHCTLYNFSFNTHY